MVNTPLLIIDYVHEDYSIIHGGHLRRYYRQGLPYVEGQILEAYEGWLGRENVRVLNSEITGLLTSSRIYLPRDDSLKYGVIPRVWIVFSASRVGDPRREEYYPVYPGKIVPYVPSKDLITARLEDIMLRSIGFQSRLVGLIYRSINVIEEIRTLKSKGEVKEGRKRRFRRRK